MSDQEKDSKTEQATPKKLQDALKKGNSFISKDLNNFISIFTLTLIFYFLLKPFTYYLTLDLKYLISYSYNFSIDQNLIEVLLITKKIWLYLILLFLFLTILMILSFYTQRGHFIFSFQPIIPSLSRLSIHSGYKRIISKKNLLDFIKNIFKIIFFLLLITLFITSKIKNLSYYQDIPIENIVNKIYQLVMNILILTSLFTIVIGLIDFSFQKKSYLDNLKMSKQEQKDEFKETEGNPIIKQYLKALRYNLLKKTLKRKIKESTVVITNPTHYAIMLKYDAKIAHAPICLSKAKNLVAQFIKKIAQENNIPIVENPELAQKLYKDLKENEIIPELYFKEIAKIIAYIIYKDQK